MEMRMMRMMVMMGTVMARINSRVPLSSGSELMPKTTVNIRLALVCCTCMHECPATIFFSITSN
jgi:hypothetical protein